MSHHLLLASHVGDPGACGCLEVEVSQALHDGMARVRSNENL